MNENQVTNRKFINSGMQTFTKDNRRDLLNKEYAVMFKLLQKTEVPNKREVEKTIKNFNLDSF